jgi:biotin carboxylase
MALTAVSAVVVARDLPGNPPESVDICRDKLQTFDALTRAGLPVPLTLTVSCLEDVVTAVDRLGYPFVVKPRSAAGGRGVSIVANAGQLEGALDRALKYAIPGQGVLAQRYVGGTSVGVEAVFWRGELVRAFVMDDQYQEGSVSPVGHALPSRLPDEERRGLVADVQRIGRALGLVDGPANFDLRRENGQTVLIECNARLGGSGITDLIRIACDVDLSEVALRTASGEAPNMGPDDGPVQATAARLILLPGRGRLQVDTDKLEALRQAPDVRVLSLTARPGEPAQLIVDRWTLIGVVLVVAETPEAAIERAAALGAALGAIITLAEEAP